MVVADLHVSLDEGAAAQAGGLLAAQGLMRSAMVPVAAALGCAAIYAALGSRWHESAGALWLTAALVGLCAGAGARLRYELKALRQLQLGIHHSLEGLLTPTPLLGLEWTWVGRLIPEHNATVAAHKLMFRTVEDCQVRFLDERNRINTILQSLPGALLGITDELRVSIANRQAESLFGAAQGGLSNLNAFDLLHLDDGGRAMLRDAFLYKHEIHNQEVVLSLDGKRRDFSVNLAFYSDDEDDIGGVMILQDVTDKRELMQVVAMREKLVAMGQLAAGVAHELNTPLGNVLGYAQLLRSSVAADPKLCGYAEIIAAETQRCSRVVQNLLAYARKDKCSGETCDLNQSVNDLIDAFIHCRLKRYGIEFDLKLSAVAPLAEGGCGEVDIVLTNIIANAIHALAGTVQPRIAISTWVEPGYAAVCVADNGPGVSSEARHRLFDPFFTTKDIGQGSGLGLFICQAIVTRRGGRIDLDTGYDDGARFIIRMPVVERARISATV